MDVRKLESTARQLVAKSKGILAADESSGTIAKRFDSIGVASTERNRRDWRELLFVADGVHNFISGVILFDETIRQKSQGGVPFPKLLRKRGILPGIKVDTGAKDLALFPGEKVTEGLDGLRERLTEYVRLGATFTKWRAVITLGRGIPTQTCIDSNAHALARFAALSQEVGLVPIVEPEVLMEGSHTITRHEETTIATLTSVFAELHEARVLLTGMLLKPNMVASGLEAQAQTSPQEVAQATVRVLLRTVPPEVPGIVFLSGGLTPEQATTNLQAINAQGKQPWELSYSFGRALQGEALTTWGGKPDNVKDAQTEFYRRAQLVSMARDGRLMSAKNS